MINNILKKNLRTVGYCTYNSECSNLFSTNEYRYCTLVLRMYLHHRVNTNFFLRTWFCMEKMVSAIFHLALTYVRTYVPTCCDDSTYLFSYLFSYLFIYLFIYLLFFNICVSMCL